MPDWLVDKSAYVRTGDSPDAALWVSRVARARIHVSTATVLEVGFSARSAREWQESVHAPPLSLMPRVSLTPAIEARAIDVQGHWRVADSTARPPSRICW